MTKRATKIIAAVIALAALGIGARAMLPARPAAPAAPAATAAAAPATLEFLPQEIVSAEPVELRQVLRLSGSLNAVDLASVKARVGGEVREVLVREGESVRAGQVVVRIDATEYEARVAQARGNLNNARAQLEIAAKTRDNNLALVERGFISKNALDNSTSQFAGAKASVDAAQGALDLVQKSLNDTVIRAPIAGLVSARLVQPGEKVAPDSKLIDIVNLQKMELEAGVPAADVARVAIGQPVELGVEGLPERFEGRVARINPATQAGSRSVPVYIRVANPQNLLRAGMFAEARLTLASKADVLALPQSALRKDGSGAYVFVIADGKIERRAVTLGASGLAGDEFRTEIASGLQVGMQVIRTDMGNLRPGTPVRVVTAAAAPN
ncbi:MAG: efflux RND transporter periplasmic adaptor subunit [Burkholderiaceae bacterium]|nr:efflux RND transporter periplasmic adaptor subunit [Burkholderiaceae bacterium]